MKKILIATVAFFSLAAVNNAQAQTGLSFSIKGTPAVTWMNNSNDRDNNATEFNPMFGASFGIGAGYEFNKNLGVELDALYSLQGRSFKTAGVESKQKVNYVKIAPMFTYTIPTSGIVSIVGKVGPQLNILTDSKLTDKDGNSITKDMNDQYESVTFGGVANIGAQFQLSKSLFLTTGLRYDMDFTNAENKDFGEYPSGRNTNLNSTAGLEVGLKVKL